MTSSTNSGSGTPAPSAAGFCAACGAPLAAGARFCHRCGTPSGQGLPLAGAPVAAASSPPSVLPWGVAFLALLALVAMFAGKNFGSAKGSGIDGSANALPTSTIDGQVNPAGAAANGMPPSIAGMSANERASRLYNRAMEASEAGKKDSANFFATMAVAAHGMIDGMTADERYHMGRAAEILGDADVMRAQGDTILQERPTSLLGLILSSRAARLLKDDGGAKAFNARLLAALQPELDSKLPDYELHRAEIDRAVADARANR